MGKRYLVIHSHFYQPPRQDPFTGEMPNERGAEPYRNFNDKINAECYKPNAEAGNFRHMSFNVGPTLAAWLQHNDPCTYNLIIDSDRDHFNRFGVGNAIAQAYNHTILPLATSHEKRVQISWGIADFVHRFGHKPDGLWLGETAVDYESLSIMAERGIKFTILAPWQSATLVDTTEPYWVRLPNGKKITVFFYNAPLSGAISFDCNATICAETFVSEHLRKQLNPVKLASGEPQLVLVATDGEVYGHHKPWRDQFLKYLLTESAPRQGFEAASLTRYLQLNPPKREVLIDEDTSWSCHHGVRRWTESCECTEGNGTWKLHLRRSLAKLAEKIDDAYTMQTAAVLRKPWNALEDYINVKIGALGWRGFLSLHKTDRVSNKEAVRVLRLLEAQYFRQLMFTSCAFFFEDLDRIEPRNNIAMAARAIELIRQAGVINIEETFLEDLSSAKSWRTGITGSEIYQEIVAAREQGRKSGAEEDLTAA